MLLPQYLQVLMGYTAQHVGHGALARRVSSSSCSCRSSASLIGRVDARKMIAFGFTVLCALALLHGAHTSTLRIDFETAVRAPRAIQSVGLAFLFVPINTLVYVGVPPEKNNAVSGIVNLSRNMGGDIGIAARHHADRAPLADAPGQPRRARRPVPARPSTRAVKGIAAALQRAGDSPVDAAAQGARRRCTGSSSSRR